MKNGLHPKNKHKNGYDFGELTKSSPALKPFVSKNKYGNDSIDFGNPLAVKALNQALLKYHYDVNYWDIPKNYLCPPIPGRADYIHHIAELLPNKPGTQIRMLDIGTGANCVYPLIAHREYGWNVVGTEVDKTALENAEKIIRENHLENAITLREQKEKEKIFSGVVLPDEFFDLSICNPPFHSSAEEARAGSDRKIRNLGLKKKTLNFGGQSTELWCEGGEEKFILTMIKESVVYQKQCRWFSTLVSKSATMPVLYEELKKMKVLEVRTLDMAQGQKLSRVLAWRFIP
jgi:23S rRNA (adenine1618-N6)-methyltransferase